MGQRAIGGSRTTRRPRYNRLVSCTQKVPKRIKNIAELERIILNRLKNPAIQWKDSKLNRTVAGTSAAAWTNALLNMVLRLGQDAYHYQVWPQGYLLNAQSMRNAKTEKRGEWQFDACWTHPALTEWVDALRNDDQASPFAGIELACESEWFHKRGADKGVAAILDDFAKLVESRASFKLMFFDYLPDDGKGDSNPKRGSYEDIKTLCEKLIETDTSKACYLLMAWPVDAAWGPPRQCLAVATNDSSR